MTHVEKVETAIVSSFVQSLQEPRTSYISPKRLSKALGVQVANLAQLTDVHRNTLRNPSSERLQGRLREMVKVITAAGTLTGASTRRSTGSATSRSSIMITRRPPNSSPRAIARRCWPICAIWRMGRAGEARPARTG